MPPELSPLVQQHLDWVERFYQAPRPPLGRLGRWYRRQLARRLREWIGDGVSLLEVGCGRGELLAELGPGDVTGVDLAAACIEEAKRRCPHGRFEVSAGETLNLGRTFDVIVVSDTLNLAADVQALLDRVRLHAHSRTRLFLTFQNHLWRWPVDGVEALRLKQAMPLCNWLSRRDVEGLLSLADWEGVRGWQEWLLPLPLGGIEHGINRWLTPWFQPLGFGVFLVARPRPIRCTDALKVTVIVPVRNEAGNLAQVLARTPTMGEATELIIVEGGSSDGTWDELQRLASDPHGRAFRSLQQPGRGKGDAVRAGLAVATGDIVMILDADLTTPPEDLPKFFEALASGRAEFANGSRLVYPMEKRAMRFLNMCANKAIGLTFSWLLGQPIKDALCGTKAFWRRDYERMQAARRSWGELDPFGDFDLLLGACRLSLRIADIPVRYRERVYGETNIRRWRDGWLLLRLLWRAARRIKFAR